MIVVAGQLVLTRTVFGRYMVAIGTNEEAVRLSGIDPRPIKVAVFLLSGVLVALAAIIDTSRFQSANPNAGTRLRTAGHRGGRDRRHQPDGRARFGGQHVFRRADHRRAELRPGRGRRQRRNQAPRSPALVIVAAVIVDHYRHRLGPPFFNTMKAPSILFWAARTPT